MYNYKTKVRRKVSDHLNSGDVWVAMFVKSINESWQNMVDSQRTVVEHYYQSFVLLFKHNHNHNYILHNT